MPADHPMQPGIIGLGRDAGPTWSASCCVTATNAPPMTSAPTRSRRSQPRELPELVSKLKPPVWIMVPAGIVRSTLGQLVPLPGAGDIVIDGGNAYYRDDIARSASLRPSGIHYVNAGTSGGVHGRERGYCLMIRGEAGPRAGGRCPAG